MRQSDYEEIKNVSRRRLLGNLWGFLGIAAFAEFIWICFSFLHPRVKQNQKPADGKIITAGSVDRFQPMTVTAFPEGKFYLARLDNGGFLALSRTCTHLGCTVPWDKEKKQFICPCHASSFDITGNVVNPPAPRALDIFPITIENNVVKVDVSTPIKRNTFRINQAVKPY